MLSPFLLISLSIRTAQADHDPWQGVIQCESGGDFGHNSGYYKGAFQFDPGTWNGIAADAGRPDLIGVNPAFASPADQYAMANALLARSGIGQWPYCGQFYNAPHPEEVAADEPVATPEATPEAVAAPTAPPVAIAPPAPQRPAQTIPAPTQPVFTG